MSNIEVNLTGSENTSGRSTSEEQGKVDFGKGINPIKMIIENKITRDIIPSRYGSGYKFEYAEGQEDMDKLKRWLLEIQSGLKSVNEIRTNEMNEMPFSDKQFDLPMGSAQQGAPGQNELNPLFTQLANQQ